MTLFTPPDRAQHLLRTLLLTNNLTVFFIVLTSAIAVFLVKGFLFRRKVVKVARSPHVKMTPTKSKPNFLQTNTATSPEISLHDTSFQREDDQYRIHLYNRMHDPSQFVFESFGFKRPLTLLLYVYRCFLAVWMTVTIILDETVVRKLTAATYLSFLTHTTACLFAFYYTCHAIFGLIYITSCNLIFNMKNLSKNHHTLRMVSLFRMVSNCMWIMGELSTISNIIVAIGYWAFRNSVGYSQLNYL